MARTKATLGEGVRLTDHLSASLLARVYPMDTVSALLDKHGCNSRRVRSFPAGAAVYFSMALSLYPEVAYEDVFAAMTQGLAWMQGLVTSPTVNKASITESALIYSFSEGDQSWFWLCECVDGEVAQHARPVGR